MIFLMILCGVLGGILGGMGMGGGTILIPMLTIFCGVEQINAQALNLVCFIPMAVVSIYIHSKNKLINMKGVYPIIIFGVLFSVVGAFVVRGLNKDTLRILFGVFLVGLSIYQFVKIKEKEE